MESVRNILFEDEDYDFLVAVDEEDGAEYDEEDSIPDVRQDKYFYPRMDLERDLEMLRRTNQFQCRYHMSEQAFNKLVELLRPKLSVDVTQSKRSTSGNGPITTEVIVGMGLRFLGGELIKSTYWHYGLSKASAYRWINKFLKAIDTTPHFDIKPLSIEECEVLSRKWNSLSGAYDVYFGCVGAIDGCLCTMEKPRKCPAPTDYFSGHYQQFGINIQAVCRPDLQFLYFGVIGPSRMNDNRAFNRCHTLRKWLASIPDGLLPCWRQRLHTDKENADSFQRKSETFGKQLNL